MKHIYNKIRRKAIIFSNTEASNSLHFGSTIGLNSGLAVLTRQQKNCTQTANYNNGWIQKWQRYKFSLFIDFQHRFMILG